MTIWIFNLDWGMVANAVDRPVIVLVVGAGVFELLWIFKGPPGL